VVLKELLAVINLVVIVLLYKPVLHLIKGYDNISVERAKGESQV
jgi:Na+/alanine symporter